MELLWNKITSDIISYRNKCSRVAKVKEINYKIVKLGKDVVLTIYLFNLQVNKSSNLI